MRSAIPNSADIRTPGADLVFVHLGNGPHRHLLTNIRATCARFPHRSVFLVVDQKHPWHLRLPRNVSIVRHRAGRAEAVLSRHVTQELNFRSGYWLNTARRYLALAAFQGSSRRPLLHIESDVALLSDPSSLMYASGKTWSYSLTSDSMGVGALLYSRDAPASDSLADFIVDHFASNPGTNDMKALGAHHWSHSKEILTLPGASSPDSLIVRESAPGRFRQAVSEAYEIFGGVFDAFALGIYLFGIDGRNNRGFRKLFSTYPFSDLDYSGCSFRCAGQTLQMRDSTRGGWVPVLSMHIHSKHVGLLGSPTSRERAISRYVRLEAHASAPASELDTWAFSVSARDAVRRRIRNWAGLLN